MTDELDVLRHERDVIEPDPEFRADLMDRLRQQMADPDGAWHARVIDLDRPPLTASPLSAGGGAFRRRSSVWLAAAASMRNEERLLRSCCACSCGAQTSVLNANRATMDFMVCCAA